MSLTQQPQPQSLLPQPQPLFPQPQLPPQLPQPKKRMMSMRIIQMQLLLLLQNIYMTFPRA